jgi:hypothetical protein
MNKVSLERKVRTFEVCVNELLKSCIEDKGSHVTSFALHETEERILRFDLYSKSEESFDRFHKKLSEVFKSIASASKHLKFFEESRRVVTPLGHFPLQTASIKCGDLNICFDLVECNEGALYVCEIGMYPASEYEFVKAYLESCESNISTNPLLDDTIYREGTWCWGMRFSIHHDSIQLCM